MRIKTYAVTFKSAKGDEKVRYFKAVSLRQANDKAAMVLGTSGGWTITNIRAI